MMESRISALTDGELDHEEANEILISAREQTELQQKWNMYHLIGDSLRHTSALSPDLNARIASQLAKEPTVLAPRRPLPNRRPLIALSAAASIAAVSLVAWVAMQFNHERDPGAAASAMIAEASTANSAASEINVNGYLAAHHEYSNAVQSSRYYQRASLEKSRDGGR
ncbi:anti sigma-E protein, RseA [Sulfuricella denitrificans skB26]|uniref:Anti sigma-E protein, RseA n=1 Tax=Sulfuricella denitrificans (strain DSM 22764 / NBRC 105220 / skB26) TaxID=1163617 RepID=S6B3K4_SULDS|nr:sigma-E factor negative regulatory protein [Sulfuricella denitrificans]BAN35217.1 anti sigma-E protein, RseA [Sulfuricella denitrificans skB26]